ncbi:NUDIX domain-containing protein 4 [Elsinoe australis]|uniref:NUDIX domain-containing protein 4 n=1 Tax=Elsinoe australis TaxID=40998 RepID=A0A4V6DXF5_9PEZI|nr:NUDIX domain-containing protein 4 [Elsinoe australis]
MFSSCVYRLRAATPSLSPRSSAVKRFSQTAFAMKAQKGQIKNITDTSTAETKWVALRKIEWVDQSGRDRTWEVASRKTRGQAGVDAVAMGNILYRPNGPSVTVLVLQYRPPIDKITSVEDAAVREFKEETGYEGKVTSVSPIVAADPGMSSANMQLAMVEVHLGENDKEPDQQLDDGEHIERVVVPLHELYDRLVEYSKDDDFMVAAKLFHWAAGMHYARMNMGAP